MIIFKKVGIRRPSTRLLVFCLLLTPLSPLAAQEEGKRVALIIGNNNYSMSPLRNAINDARLMDKALRAAGFKTILREDATLASMEEGAAELAGQLGPDDTALFFYAGHGVQIENENLLVPVDFEAASSVIQAKFKCFHISQLFEELKKRVKRSIVILDACRSNPVAESHGLTAGLAQPQLAGTEAFIAFSTSPGQVAADNPAGRDSWFTEALGDLVQQPGLTLDDVFTRVKSRVKTDTEGRQAPWTQSSLTTTFYFHPPSNIQAANDPVLAEKWMLEAQRREQRQEWSQALALVEQVLKRKPGGVLEATAKAKLPYLQIRKEAQQKYDSALYQDAGQAYEKALELDAFSIDAAFQAVDSYLLAEQLPEAVRMLTLVRLRGTSASVNRANAMLQQLAPVYSEAGDVVKSEIPPPPPLRELFKTVQFGVPDWNAGARSARSSPTQLARWSKALETAYPPPEDLRAASGRTDGAANVAADIFHIEVNPTAETRDLSIRKINDKDQAANASLMLIGSPADARVVSGGTAVAEHLPYTLKLVPGKYEIRTVERGQVTDRKEVEVLPYKTSTFPVQARLKEPK